MIQLAVYDITDGKTRQKTIMHLKNRGMKRIPKSVFIGDLSQKQQNKLKNTIEELKIDQENSILIFTLCQECAKKTKNYGKKHNTEDHTKKNYIIFD